MMISQVFTTQTSKYLEKETLFFLHTKNSLIIK